MEQLLGIIGMIIGGAIGVFIAHIGYQEKKGFDWIEFEIHGDEKW